MSRQMKGKTITRSKAGNGKGLRLMIYTWPNIS